MASYKHPCKYCGKLIARDSSFCSFCTHENPLGSMKCPVCRYSLEEGAKVCGHCGVLLWITCKNCGKETFLGDKCSNCSAPIVIICPNPKCRTEQSPASKNCIKCGKPLR